MYIFTTIKKPKKIQDNWKCAFMFLWIKGLMKAAQKFSLKSNVKDTDLTNSSYSVHVPQIIQIRVTHLQGEK